MKLIPEDEHVAEQAARFVEFVGQNWHPGTASAAASADARSSWFAALIERGWQAPGWPQRYGGCEWTPLELYLWQRTTAKQGAPAFNPVGTQLAGPLLMGADMDEPLRRQLLADTLTGDLRWGHTLAAGLELRLDADCQLTGRAPWIEADSLPNQILSLAAEPGGETLVMAEGCRELRPHPSVEGVWRGRFEAARVRILGRREQGRALVQSLLVGAVGVLFPVAELEAFRHALTGLFARVVEGDSALENRLQKRLNEVGVRLAGLDALERRAALARDPEEVRAAATTLLTKSAEVSRVLGEIGHELLGYQALPELTTRPGDNEPAPVPDYALPVIQGMIRGRPWADAAGDLAHDAAAADLATGIDA